MDYTEILKIVIWPLTVVIIVMLLRNQLVKRIKSATFGDKATIEFSETNKPLFLPHQNDSQRKFTIRNDRPANVYWLGHDLMWTMDAIYRGAPNEKIVHGLNQVVHHLNQIGGGPSGYANEVHKIIKWIEANDSIAEDSRRELGGELDKLLYRIGGDIQAQQPEFLVGNPERKIISSE